MIRSVTDADQSDPEIPKENIKFAKSRIDQHVSWTNRMKPLHCVEEAFGAIHPAEFVHEVILCV